MIKELISSTNKNIGKIGVVLTIRKLIKRCNTEVVIQRNEEVDNILENFSGVIVANHPADSGVLALWSAVKDRKDISLIVTSRYYNLMPELDKYLIPVYVHNQPSKNIFRKIRLKIFGLFKKFNKYSREEEHQKNIASINVAIEKINKGGLVIIFPNGAVKSSNWFNGISYIIQGIKNKKKNFVIMSYIEGSSNWDWLRFFPLIGKLLPKFRVSFNNPLRMDTIKKENPKATTIYLENEYREWVGSLNLWTKFNKSFLWLKMIFLFLINRPY